MKFPENYQVGFSEPDGTLEEYLDWGWEIGFVYNDTKYRIDYGYYGGRDIIDCVTNKTVHHVESEAARDFLDSAFLGKKVEDILLHEAYITELH